MATPLDKVSHSTVATCLLDTWLLCLFTLLPNPCRHRSRHPLSYNKKEIILMHQQWITH